MTERAENEVWVEHPNKLFAHIRIGPKANLAVVNRPEMAECMAEAARQFLAGADSGMSVCAKGNHK